MASNRIVLIITALLLILASTCVLADREDDERYETSRAGDVRLAGIVSDIDYGTEVFAIKDGKDRYTIIAEGTKIQLHNGRNGSLRDIRDGMMVRILGSRITSYQISAHTLIVLEDTGKFDNGRNSGEYYYDQYTDIDGYVTQVNTRDRQITVRSSRGNYNENYVVDITSATEIRRSDYLSGINGIREGDDVAVTGTPRGKGRIEARFIRIYSYGRDYDDRNNHRVGTVEGTVSSTTGYFDRTLTIRVTYGDVKVDVAKNAEVYMDGRSASIHGIPKGMRVRVYGEWDGNTLIASRVDAYTGSYYDDDRPGGGYRPPTDPRSRQGVYPQSRQGVITSIDTRKGIIKMDIGYVDMTVNASDAEVTNKGSKINLGRLQKGDKILVNGDYSADTLKARTIQVLKWAEEMGIDEKW